MSTAGEILGNNVTVSSPHTARMRIEWQLASQDTGGNFSTINWQAYVDYGLCDAELDNGHVNTNVGAVYNNGGRVYNYQGNFTNHTVTIGTGSFNIGHNSDGTQVLQMNGSIAIFGSGTSSCGTTTWALPTIPRFANIITFNVNPTDEGIEFDWSADQACDFISWWSTAYDGGGHHDIGASGGGPFTINLHNLISGKTYDITVAVRRADSGQWTISGTSNPTVKTQNNFFRRRVP